MRFGRRPGSGGRWTLKVWTGLHALLQLTGIAAPRLARVLHRPQPAAAQQMPHLCLLLLQSPPGAFVGDRH